ncbi:TPA: hypothetical protein U2M17_002603 [Providencia stuartii]|uniref:hypothetical protein n=1 Tax=Providencia stuartii TaxID=588 RepID=UPI000536A56F|nr:hypothetical protein [Providencia stuartii]AXO20070.1 hypothetical protein MC79_016640 [Providencia stuartii]MBN5592909.1 hypothetical protein [Providencia stuartii]HEM6907574.1 hypothetical protein [Providencia stuartii]HEM7154122.1 hypothetical protein [Providencia stuartii]HEM7522625.1 hypothetical protein [Providencia stuartii]
MELNTTPSPWEVRDGFIYGADGDIVAEGYGYVGDDNLIAAAPELLEALQKLVIEYKFTRSQLNGDTDEELEDVLCVINANKAITKALGQQ